MTKLSFDLTLIPLDYAKDMRATFQILIDRGDPKVRLLNRGTVLELDYGLYELEQFQGIKPSPMQRLLKYPRVIDKKTLVEHFGTDEYKDNLKDVMEDARQRCRDFDYEDIDDIAGNLARPGTGGVTDALANQDGLIIGGAHNDPTHRAPVMEMLASGAMSAHNQTGLLFVEELPASSQTDIDLYLASDDTDDMPPKLRAYMEAQSKVFNTDFVRMLELARTNDVRVVGTDADEVKIYDDVLGAVHHERRCAAQNMKSADIMKAAMAAAPGQKFVAMVGGAHSNTHEGGVPGLSQLLGVPAITVDVDGKLNQAVEDPSKRGAKNKAEAAFIDGYLAKMKEVFEDGQDRLLNWREQRAAAETMASVFSRGGESDGGILKDGADIQALIDSPAVARDLQACRKRAEERKAGKEELVKLLETDKVDEFRARLDALSKTHPDLLHHDGEEGLITGVMAKAVANGHADLVPDCVAKGAALSPDIADTLFDSAMTNRQIAVSRQGIPEDQADLDFAAALQTLLDAGCNPNGKNQTPKKTDTGTGDQRDMTPLQKMIANGLGAGIPVLIAGGAATGIKDAYDRSMLDLAVQSKQPGTIGALTAAGFDPDTPGPDGKPPLIAALEAGDMATSKALLAQNADPDVTGAGGKTALHLAAEAGDRSVIDALVAKGADTTLADDNGDTATKAMLITELRHRVDEATNGDRRAAEAAAAQLADKQAVLAAQNDEVAALEQELQGLQDPSVDRDDDDGIADFFRITDISLVELPEARLRKAALEQQRDALQATLDQHRNADPMKPLVDASNADIAGDKAREKELESVISRARGMAGSGRTEEIKQEATDLAQQKQTELNQLRAQIADKEEYHAVLLAPQPIDDRLIQKAADQIATTGAMATAPDVTLRLAAAGGAIDTLRDQMLDRQSMVQQMASAVRGGDGAEIDRLAGLDGTLVNAIMPGDRNDRPMLAFAAYQQNANVLDRLIANHADATATDKRGANALHAIFGKRQDDPQKKTAQKDMVAALKAAGADIDARDKSERSCLHLACLDGNPDAITYLLAQGADETLTDKNGWTARDVVVATTKPIAEKAYADAAGVNISPPLIKPGDGQLSTLAILKRATKCENPEDVDRIEAMFDNLYAEPTFRKMLDLIALDAAHGHVAKVDGQTDTGLRIFVAAHGQVGLLYNKNMGEGYESEPNNLTPVGAYDQISHVVMVGASPGETGFVPGTLIHELTHAATRIIYGTADIPVDAPEDGYTDAGGKMNAALANCDYVQAIMADARGAGALGNPAHLALNSDASRIRDVLFGRFNGNYKQTGDEALLQEYLVSVPQLIAEFGRDAVNEVAPSMLGYFEGGFSDACEDASARADYNDVRHRIDNDDLLDGIGPPVVRAPDTDIAGSSARASLVDVLGAVGAIYCGKHGDLALAKDDEALAGKLSLPYGPGNFKLGDREQRAFDKKMAVISKALGSSYDQGDLPEKIDATKLANMAQELVQLAENTSGKALRNGVADAAGCFVRDARFTDLENRYAQGELLSNRDVAELTLLRAEDRVWTEAHAGPGIAPRIKFNAKDHAKALDAMEERLTGYLDEKADETRGGLDNEEAKTHLRAKLLGETLDVQGFIDSQVDILAGDRGMRVGRDNVVKIDASRARNAWYAELQQLAG